MSRYSKYEGHWSTYHPGFDVLHPPEPTRKRAIQNFCGDTKNWKYWYRQGWRVIRVKVTPLDERIKAR